MIALVVACAPPPPIVPASPVASATQSAAATTPAAVERPSAVPRGPVSGLGDDVTLVARSDSGPYATDGEAVAFTRGRELLVATSTGVTAAYESAAGMSGPLIRPDGFRGGRLAFVDVGSGFTADSLVVTVQVGRGDAKPVVLDHVQLVLAGGGPWVDEPRPITNGFQVLWLRREPGPPPSYVLLRSLGGEPGTVLHRSPDPFLFTTNEQGDVLVATTPAQPTATARFTVIEKTGRTRVVAERSAVHAGVPLGVGDRFGWSDGLIERSTVDRMAGGGPPTAVDLWNVLSGAHERVDVPCALAGATSRHLVGFCPDRIVVRDVLTGATGELPQGPRRYLVVAKAGLLRGDVERWTLAPTTSTIDHFPEVAPTVVWSTNRAPGADAVSLYLYYGTPAPLLGAGTRLVDRAGTVIALGPVLGSGIFGPESCVARVDGSLYNHFRLAPAIVEDLAAHPDRYRFEVELGGAWHALNALDSGCRTALGP